MVLPMSERLLQEIRDEVRKSNSTLNKMLEVMDEYVRFRKKQNK